MFKLIKNFIKYQVAKIPGSMFVDERTGAVYISDEYGEFLQTLILGPVISTGSDEALSPGIGYSSLVLSDYKDMNDFKYIGRL